MVLAADVLHDIHGTRNLALVAMGIAEFKMVFLVLPKHWTWIISHIGDCDLPGRPAFPKGYSVGAIDYIAKPFYDDLGLRRFADLWQIVGMAQKRITFRRTTIARQSRC
jgi:hypothetical protein